MEIDSPFSFNKVKCLSPIPKKLFSEDNDELVDVYKDRLVSVHRRLSFEHDYLGEYTDKNNNDNSNDDMKENGSVKDDPNSPPYKRIKSLSVFDSSTPCNGRKTPPSKDVSLISSVTLSPKIMRFRCEKYKLSPVSLSNSISRLNCTAPVNPFTPSGRVIVSANHKRKQKQREVFRDWLYGSSSEEFSNESSKNVSNTDAESKSILGPNLFELETSRFSEEFKVDEFIASGSFGVVHKCTNYLDGMEYAIKKSAQPVAGTNHEQLARREVFAHAALRSHLHIVTYFSSWIEGGHLYIQTEYCNGGSLDQLIKNTNHIFTESKLNRLINHVSKGLKYIHSQNLAHMDIKPANILINIVDKHDTSDEELDDIDDRDDNNLIYKIGDLGHIIVVDEPYDVEDGDCRYMPKELLNENYDNLKKADIFSFGMTLFEAAGGGPLPKNGDEWQNLRNGKIPYLSKHSSHLNEMIKRMLHPEPEKRPDVGDVLQQTRVTKSRLQHEICSYKMKSDFYAHHLQVAGKCLKSFSFPSVLNNSQPSILKCEHLIPKIVIDHP